MTNSYTPYRERSFESSSKMSGELARRPSVSNTPNRKGAEKFGVEKLSVGDRVAHAMFGEGSILSSRDMGGDVLYEVRFDNGQTKKLMATFAKLKKI